MLFVDGSTRKSADSLIPTTHTTSDAEVMTQTCFLRGTGTFASVSRSLTFLVPSIPSGRSRSPGCHGRGQAGPEPVRIHELGKWIVIARGEGP